MSSRGVRRIKSFNLEPGTILADKYEVVKLLGRGWEGEVYRVRELSLGIERAAKLFFPQRNRRNKAVRFYARKLHKLRDCPILIQYHTREVVDYDDTPVTVLVSEYVEGRLLEKHLKGRPGKRMAPFEALHLLHALACGVDKIHKAKEYHGDLHSENVIVRRRGIYFSVKLVDMYDWGPPSAENIQDDVVNLVQLFHECVGGARWYSRQPQYVKDICCGLKKTLILKKFRTAGQLRRYLETMELDQAP